MRMPGARVVSTVVASVSGDGGEADDQQAVGGEEEVDHLGVAAAGAAVVGERRRSTITRPPSQVQKPAAASRGKASDRAPTCSGTIATATPSSSGTSTPNTSPIAEGGEQLGQRAGVEAASRCRRPARARAARRRPRWPARASSEQPIILTADDLGVGRRQPRRPVVADAAACPPRTSCRGDVARESGRDVGGAHPWCGWWRGSTAIGDPTPRRTLPVGRRVEPKSVQAQPTRHGRAPGRRRSWRRTAP